VDNDGFGGAGPDSSQYSKLKYRNLFDRHFLKIQCDWYMGKFREVLIFFFA
jgi:hypothetical protein